MIKYEVNKVTKKDVDISVADAIRYVLKNKEYDISPNKIQSAMYTGRNYNLSKLRLKSALVAENGDTNLMQISDISKYSRDYILNGPPQVIGKLICSRMKATICNCVRKSDLTVDKIRPIIEGCVNNILYTLPVLPVGANYVSDNDPSELLKGKWELKAETKIGKIWERVQ